MSVAAAPALCVDAMGVANASRSFASFLRSYNALNSPRRVRSIVGEGGRWTRLLAQQGSFRLKAGQILKHGDPFHGYSLGRRPLCVRASRSDEDQDVGLSQQIRERSDSEREEEDGVSKGTGIGDEVSVSALHDEGSAMPDVGSRRRFRNRFLGLVKLRSNIAAAAAGVFKSEIRRRIFVTIVLLMASRAGYFIPLPGFDRRSMPGDYLGFVSGAVGENIAFSHLKSLIC